MHYKTKKIKPQYATKTDVVFGDVSTLTNTKNEVAYLIKIIEKSNKIKRDYLNNIARNYAY